MDQSFDSRLQFHKCAELDHARNGAANALAHPVLFRHSVPGLRLKLLEAHGDAPLFGIDLQHLDFKLLPF